MTIKKMEVRLNELQLDSTDEGLKVSGYVNKTNQWSQPLGSRRKFIEKIEPGAFRKALQNGNEIHFLAEHDNAKILSSTKNGSLTLREDDQGLYMEAIISDTSWGRDYHTLIKDGIIQNMSFGMQVIKDSWKKMSDGMYQRSISDIYLGEVSAVRNPAYVQSTIAARSIEVVEDVEIPIEVKKDEERKDEQPLSEKIENTRSSLKLAEMLVANGDNEAIELVNILKGEIVQMESQLKEATATKVKEKEEERAMTVNSSTALKIMPINLIREKVKQMGGKHSLVTRTDIVVQSGGKIEVLLEDGENYKENLFVGEMVDLKLGDFTATKVAIQTDRIGHAIEVSELLLEKSVLEDQEKSFERKLIGRIEDSINYCMLTPEGNMDNLNDDNSVYNIISTVGTDAVSLVDVLTLISKLNQEYREGAVFIMHTNVFNQILINKTEFPSEYLKLVKDEFSGKNLYFLCGYPILVNDNADTKRILLGNLFEGYKTIISEGLKKITQDIYGNKINKEVRSFDLFKTTDSNRQAAGKPVYQMDAYVGGKVINKDCFVRLDVKQVTASSEPATEAVKEVENPVKEVDKQENVVTASAEALSDVKPVTQDKPKQRKKSKA